MGKVMGFLAGAVCGALVGGVAALLLTPASGTELVQNVEERWQLTLSEARQARDEKRRELETQYRMETQ
ncbi:MAG: YtxH domain-containing protein [Candidatus Promineofilum sp.]|nr:YtxH domain-containing protein [Promineifilum sp.]